MLYQLSYFRKNIPYRSPPPPSRQPFGRPGGLRNSNRFLKWEVMDSNHRRRKPADLQSAPFDRSGNFPYFPPQRGGRCSAESDIPKNSGDFQPRSVFVPSHRQALRSRPASLASAFGADGGIRTPDQLITNQLLWPTELHRQNQPFWIAKVGIFFLSRKYSAIFFLLFDLSQRTASGPSVKGAKPGAKIGKFLNTATACTKNITLRNKGRHRVDRLRPPHPAVPYI